MGKNAGYKAMQASRHGAPTATDETPQPLQGDGTVDVTFHTPAWHAARIQSLMTERVSLEEWKKKIAEEEEKKNAMAADGKAMDEYRAALEADREKRFGGGSSSKDKDSKKKRKRKDEDDKRSSKKRHKEKKKSKDKDKKRKKSKKSKDKDKDKDKKKDKDSKKRRRRDSSSDSDSGSSSSSGSDSDDTRGRKKKDEPVRLSDYIYGQGK